MGAALRVVIERGDPFLGICMGMQLLFDGSDENGGQEGLHVMPGRCRRFPDGQVEEAEPGAVERVMRPANVIPEGMAAPQSMADPSAEPMRVGVGVRSGASDAEPGDAPDSASDASASGEAEGSEAAPDGDVPPPPTWSGPTVEEVDHGTTITMSPLDADGAIAQAATPAPEDASGSVRLMRRVKVPHMGWNEVEPTGSHYYFVHSYYVEPERSEDVMWMSRYGGIRFPAAVRRGNVMGCQFHPEKSQRAGLRFLRAFLLGGWG